MSAPEKHIPEEKEAKTVISPGEDGSGEEESGGEVTWTQEEELDEKNKDRVQFLIRKY